MHLEKPSSLKILKAVILDAMLQFTRKFTRLFIVEYRIASKSARHDGYQWRLNSDFTQNSLRADLAHWDMHFGYSKAPHTFDSLTQKYSKTSRTQTKRTQKFAHRPSN